MDNDFVLHPRLQDDCYFVSDLPLCRLLMMDDAQYPWFILVPRRKDITEVYQLNEAEESQLWRESRQLSQTLMRVFTGDKLNLAALGNVVAQLHLHHVVRYSGDIAWPDPVWGKYRARPYTENEATQRIRAVKQALT